MNWWLVATLLGGGAIGSVAVLAYLAGKNKQRELYSRDEAESHRRADEIDAEPAGSASDILDRLRKF